MVCCTPSQVFTKASPSPSSARPRPFSRPRNLALILALALCIVASPLSQRPRAVALANFRMAEDGKEDAAAAAPAAGEPVGEEPPAPEGRKKQRKGILSRIWHGIFRGGKDFEKRLQYLSQEETSVHMRVKRRAQCWRRTARNIRVFSVLLECFSAILLASKPLLTTYFLGKLSCISTYSVVQFHAYPTFQIPLQIF
ncbi:hypothetical protein Taro_049523, partial [Colocasia esculenta]|nr:hypothetical protein [Colocasia esculenta]